MASGCGCKEVYRFFYPTLVSAHFCNSIPTVCSFKLFFPFFIPEKCTSQFDCLGSPQLND